MKTVAQIAILALGVGYLSHFALGADKEPRAAEVPGNAVGQGGNVVGYGTENDKFDLAFPGGTPSALIDAITKSAQQSPIKRFHLNVLIPPELNDVRIPPMELRSVDVGSVFQSLNMLSRNGIQWTPNVSRGRGGFVERSASEVWILTRRSDDRKTQAFYVGNLLKKFKVDDITTAVQTTWELGAKEGGNMKPELKYHKETQLLIVRAYPAQIETMTEVMSQLRLAVEPATATDAGAEKKAH